MQGCWGDHSGRAEWVCHTHTHTFKRLAYARTHIHTHTHVRTHIHTHSHSLSSLSATHSHTHTLTHRHRHTELQQQQQQNFMLTTRVNKSTFKMDEEYHHCVQQRGSLGGDPQAACGSPSQKDHEISRASKTLPRRHTHALSFSLLRSIALYSAFFLSIYLLLSLFSPSLSLSILSLSLSLDHSLYYISSLSLSLS